MLCRPPLVARGRSWWACWGPFADRETASLHLEAAMHAGMKLHPNRDAPRCLPCDYSDALLEQGCPGRQGFIAPQVRCIPALEQVCAWRMQLACSRRPSGIVMRCDSDGSCGCDASAGQTEPHIKRLAASRHHAWTMHDSSLCDLARPQGCPCWPETLLANGNWMNGDQGVLDRVNLSFQASFEDAPHPGWWYMLHGGVQPALAHLRCLGQPFCTLASGLCCMDVCS